MGTPKGMKWEKVWLNCYLV